MARVRRKSIDQADVGVLGGDLFKPDKVRQRIALIPAFMLESELVITEALTAKAKEGDLDAQDELEELDDLKVSFEEGLKAEPARVKKAEFSLDAKPAAPGYLYARADSHLSHYIADQKMSILCKKHEYEALGREAICCTHADPPSWGGGTAPAEARISYVVVVVAYKTDLEGDIIKLPETKQKTLDEKNVLDFSYSLQTWQLSDSRMRAWKEHHKTSPLITSDFVVWLEKRGQSDVIKFTPVQGAALWMDRGPLLFQKILREAAPTWEGAARWIGKDYSVEEIDTMYGIKNGGAAAPQLNEQKFDNLLK